MNETKALCRLYVPTPQGIRRNVVPPGGVTRVVSGLESDLSARTIRTMLLMVGPLYAKCNIAFEFGITPRGASLDLNPRPTARNVVISLFDDN